MNIIPDGTLPDFSSQINEKDIFSVSELTRSIQFVLEEEFSTVRVSGEISNFRVPSSGHAYFVLKDRESQIKCVLFRGNRQFLKFEPEDGMEVVVRGSVGVYTPRGEYQIIASSLEPRGAGALQVAFEQLKAKLFKEGLFDKDSKKPLPQFPEKIGIVTSPTGAAVRDMLHILNRRFPNVHILICPAKVQGEGAAEEIAAGVDLLNTISGVDIIIVGRGGGSIEDLWAFNEEMLARAIFRSKIPVISAVGHETDYTIADFTADLRAPTPSAAAELAVRNIDDVKRGIEQMRQRLFHLMKSRVSRSREIVRIYSEKRVLKDPRARVNDFLQRMDEYNGRLNRAVLSMLTRKKERVHYFSKRASSLNPRNYIGQYRLLLIELQKRLNTAIVNEQRLQRKRLHEIAGRLGSLSPLGIMERGYSICFSLPEKKILRDSRSVSRGDAVMVKLSAGGMTCTVLDTQSPVQINQQKTPH